MLDGEFIANHKYNGVRYYLEIFHIEKGFIKVFVSFQVDVDNEKDELTGMGEHLNDRDTAVIKAIKNLHSQYN